MAGLHCSDRPQLVCPSSSCSSKKLKGAARFLYGADTRIHDEIDDDLRAQCALLHIDPARLVSSVALSGGPAPFELWPEHVDAFEVFYACRRQWRIAVGAGGVWYQGLDMGAIDVTMRRLDIPQDDQREVFLQLQIMEDEAAKVLND